MAAPKKTVKKIALAPLKINLAEKPVKKGDVLTILIEGDYASRYNEASAIGKAAETLMKDYKPVLLPEAVSQIFAKNFETPWEPIASIAFQDAENNVLRISSTNRYADITADIAEKLFDTVTLKQIDATKPPVTANINDYLARTVVPTFDGKCFTDAEGRFDKERYNKIVAALDTVSQELGIVNPLTCTTTVKPLASFHTRRWLDFDLETNKRISSVISNQYTFTPCPNAVSGKMVGEVEEVDKVSAS